MTADERCPECGSWGVECSWTDPIPDCGCARCLAARVRELEAQREQDIEAAYYRGYHDGACDPDIDVLCKAMDEKGGSA